MTQVLFHASSGLSYTVSVLAEYRACKGHECLLHRGLASELGAVENRTKLICTRGYVQRSTLHSCEIGKDED